jgi:hypothetical protein
MKTGYIQKGDDKRKVEVDILEGLYCISMETKKGTYTNSSFTTHKDLREMLSRLEVQGWDINVPSLLIKADTGETKMSKKKSTTEKKTTTRKPTAASRYRELILAGGKTDAQIFAIVKKQFDLDDSKNHVAWYRGDLIRKGQEVPEVKIAKKGKGKK